VHARGRQALAAERAGPVGERERHDDDVALPDLHDLRSDVLDADVAGGVHDGGSHRPHGWPVPFTSTTPSERTCSTLARPAQPIGPPPRRRTSRQRIRPSVQQLLDAMTGAAAHVGNERLDILGANALGRRLFLAWRSCSTPA